MAYEVTATRRRPQSLEDLVGQEFVASTLKNSIETGKIAHAYLFSGPRGCGKTSTARILAKMLNCHASISDSPCGQCPSCKEIASGFCMDVIEIDGASNTSVNDIRQIKDEVLFPPNSCKYKIYIIDEVHMLSTSAFNALLKTIEEPPEYIIFIFATTELHKVPATIKSRCQQFNFRLGSVEQVKELLEKTATEIGIKADAEALYWIARESTGSFRDAYTLFDQVAAFSNDHITYEKIRDKLGLVGTERLNDLCEICVSANSGLALEKLDEYLQAGISIEQFITNISDYIRSLLLIQSGITKEALLGQNIDRFSKIVLNSWDSIRLERALSLFMQLYRDVRYSLSPRYELELAITRLCWLSSYVSQLEVKRAIDSARNLLAGSSADNSISQNNQQMHSQNNTNQFARIQNTSFHSQDYDSSTTHTPHGMPTFSALQESQSEPQKEQPPDPFVNSDSSSVENETSTSAVATERTLIANSNLTLLEVKQNVIDELRLSKAILATTLSQSGEWTINNNNIIIAVDTPFSKHQLDPDCNIISNMIDKIWGKKFSVSIELVQKEEEKQEEAPDFISTICNVFNGNLVTVQNGATQTGFLPSNDLSDDTKATENDFSISTEYDDLTYIENDE